MRKLLFVLVLLAPSFAQPSASPTSTVKTIAFTNGKWFDGRSFRPRTGYSVSSVLTFRRPARVDTVVDLGGGFVIPPFGEAHNHNVEPLAKIDLLIPRYLQHGIFYVKNPNNLPTDRDKVLPKLNQPESIDVVFSNGGFTGKDGHPAELVKRNIDRGVWSDTAGDGAFYYAVNDEAELERKWPQFLATKPDFVKTYLLFSENYDIRKDDPQYFGWKGLDPELLKIIVQKTHAAGLRVSTHVESGVDFHNALLAGVDEINHTPGFRINADVKPHKIEEFQITERDAKLAAKRGVYVVTTLSDNSQPVSPGALSPRDELNRRNLMLLRKFRVKLALGSDAYRGDTVPEARYIASLGVFDGAGLLRIWCDNTAKTIFPGRKIGQLKEGYEASFLVLKRDPLQNVSAIQDISMRVKQGHVLQLESSIEK